MDSAYSKGEASRGWWNVSTNGIWKENEKELETNDHQGHLCRRRLHSKGAQVREIHPAHWLEIQESSHHSPRVENYFLLGYSWSEEESFLGFVHVAGGYHEGHDHRGECQWAGSGHSIGKGSLGKICANYERPRAWWVYKWSSAGLNNKGNTWWNNWSDNYFFNGKNFIIT